MLPVNEEIRLSNNNNTIGTVHLITKLSLDTVDIWIMDFRIFRKEYKASKDL